MITGAIVFVIAVAMIASANEGQWGSVAVGAVIIVLALALASAGRSNARAYNNFVNYWSKGGPDGEASRGSVRRRTVTRRVGPDRETDKRYVNGVRTAGDVMRLRGTTIPCRMCGGVMEEFSRIRYSSGAEFVTYECPRCRKQIPVKVG